MRDAHDALAEAGAHVVAVSPDEPEASRLLIADLRLPFVVLSDRDVRVAATFGVMRHDEVAPSAVLVDRRGAVQWSFVGRHHGDQPSVRTVLGVLHGRRSLSVPGPSQLLTPAGAALAAAMLVVLGLLAAGANHDLLVWDRPVQRAVQDIGDGPAGSVLEMTNQLGSRWLIAALTLPMAVLAWTRCRQLAVVLILALPAGLALELLLKALVDRPRPPMANGFGSSFPSGHVLAAAAFWGLVPPWTFIVTRRRLLWAASTVAVAVVVLTVGLSRVYVGAHWPSDVVGGYVGGALFLLAAEWAVRRPSRVLRCDTCDLHPLHVASAGADRH